MFAEGITKLTDRINDDNGTRIADKIEARLQHGEQSHSVIHDELRKLQQLDSNCGVVDSAKFKHDVHKVEHNLHNDGYLPNLHINVDHNNHVNLETSRNRDLPSALERYGTSIASRPWLPPLNLDQHRDDPKAARQFDPPYQGANPYRYSPPYREPSPYRESTPYHDSDSYRKPNPYESNQFQRPGTERFENQLRPSIQNFEQIRTDGEFKELKLENRSSNHAGADALVYVRKDFDSSKPVHLVVYNHGFESTVGNALQREKIKEMMSHAQANTVLLLPEWQATPGSRSGNSGPLAQQNKFTNMVQEALQKTPALHGVSLSKVDKIDIIAHSAGYSPTENQIYKNPAIARKVHSITLLDSLYDRHGFDSWLQSNIGDLSTGRKQFYNFSNTSTSSNSRSQAIFVAGLLRKNELPTDNYKLDYNGGNGQVGRHAAAMSGRSIVFASTTVRHGEIPGKYIGPTLAALNPETERPVPIV
ncbi:hypothetical protein BH10CYA1_BH10CYA1_38200 [soil metagenome]